MIKRFLVGPSGADIVARFAQCGQSVRIRMPTVVVRADNVFAGSQIDIGEFCHIRANDKLTIGNRVLIASHVVITTAGHPITPPRWANVEMGPIVIGDEVWIGAGSTILPGVTIGDNCVVAAGSVVTKDVSPNCVVAGVPAQVIGTTDLDEPTALKPKEANQLQVGD
jgi:acetyltransferase-like isoleucine patch superfamily enzyme